ncbi:MAG: FtsW/RodA/SpoVE family cell cycle protein [[Ruminococcus] torques]
MICNTSAEICLGRLIAAGAMAHMMIQVILNIAVVTNSIPNTGITLPFISYGGTSVVFLLLEMGLVLSVSDYEGLRYGGSVWMKRKKHRKRKLLCRLVLVVLILSCIVYGCFRSFYVAQGHMKWKEILITGENTITTWIRE